MSKYDPLYDYLRDLPGREWYASFAQIEKILGDRLPDAASEHRSWWANDRTHTQARAWLDAGWETSDVVLGKKLTFIRR